MNAAPKLHPEIARIASKVTRAQNDLAPQGPRIEWNETSAIFAPLAPPRWVIPGLQIGPGRPNMVVAYSGTGKTIVEQSIALCVAAGRPVWERFTVDRPMVVRHFDYEQGRTATHRRYQRLARGHSIELADLGDRLKTAIFPSVYLTDPDAETEYLRATEGVDLAIVDALRGTIPGVDENESVVRKHLDICARVSEKNGVAFKFIHHAGKGDPDARDARMLARGSSAIQDAVGCQFTMIGGKGEPKRVTHTKAHLESEGGEIPDFYVTIEDAPEGALRVVYQDEVEDAATSAHDALKGRIMDLLAREKTIKAADVIAVRVKTKATAVRTAIRDLEGKGVVVKRDGVFRLASDLKNEGDS